MSHTQNTWSKLVLARSETFSVPKTYEGSGTYISIFQFNSTIKCLSESGSALDSGDTEMNLVKRGKIK